MDALALLCTLHADGPSTAKRLREAGCATLDRVLALEASALAALLRSPPAVARRFQREARGLVERLGVENLEPSPTLVAPIGALPPLDQRLAERVVAEWKEQREVAAASLPTKALPDAGSQASLPALLDPENSAQGFSTANASARARELSLPIQRAKALTVEDLGSRESMPRRLAADESSNLAHARCAAEGLDLARDAAQELDLVRPEAGTVLLAFAVDGLNSEAAHALALAGIHDLPGLAACDPLALARASGLTFPRVVRWRALAARACPPLAREPARCEPFAVERLPTPQVVGSAPAMRAEGTGGPFA